MAENLNGMRVAILAADGFEQSELLEPKRALEQAGAKPEIVSPKSGEIQGMQHDEKGQKVTVDRTLGEARADEYEALVLPGGVANPDKLRTIPEAVGFVRAFFEADKPVAAICHGPWTIIEADQARGHEMTSWPSLKTDLRNAGANWVDREVVVDRNLVTSRKPDDLPAFNAKMIEIFARRARRRAAAE
jgi:protease I